MIASSYRPTIGGLENYMHELTTRLAKSGHKITIQTIQIPNTKKYERIDNIEIRRAHIPNIPLTKQIFWFFIVVKAIYKLRKDIDIIHAYPIFMTGIFANIIGKLINKPIIIREGMSSYLLQKVLNIPLASLLISHGTRNAIIYANNMQTVNLFKRYKVSIPNMKIIKTPIDIYVFKPVENKELKKIELGIDSNFTLLYVGRLIHWKKVDLLIRAMPKLISLIPNIKLVLVGDGTDKNKLVRLAEELKVSNHITFCGFIPQDEVHNYFQMADVFVTLTTHAEKGESYSHPDTTIYQAMACNLPIVSPPDMQGTSNKECPDVLDSKIIDTGIIVDNNDLENFVDAVVCLYENPNTSIMCGKYGRKIVTEKLSWNKHIGLIEKMYLKSKGGN